VRIERFGLGQIGDAQHGLGDRWRHADDPSEYERSENGACARESKTGHDDLAHEGPNEDRGSLPSTATPTANTERRCTAR
jgi:hypothetical protein